MEFLNLKKDNRDNYDRVNLRSIINEHYYHWKWYVIGISIFSLLSIGIFYFSANNFDVSSIVLLEKNGGVLSDMSMDGSTKTSEVEKNFLANEMGVLKSKLLIEKVINKLDINVKYFEKSILSKNEIYGQNIPVKIDFLEEDSIFNKRDTLFKILPKSESKFYIESEDGNNLEIHNYGKEIATKFGKVNVTLKNGNSKAFTEPMIITIAPIIEVVEFYSKKVSIDLEDINSNLLKLELISPIKNRSIDILNGIINEYNLYAFDYKKTLTKSTDDFINERITEISNSLNNMDKGVEVFKTQNDLSNIEFESNLNLESSFDLESQINDLNSQIQLINYLLSYLKNDDLKLIPSNIGIKDEVISKNISDYNLTYQEMKGLLTNTSVKHPKVIKLTGELHRMKNNIKISLQSLRSVQSSSLSKVNSKRNILNSKKQLAPKQEREYQEIKRQQQKVEDLYLFMMQKREENAILMETKIPKLTVIDPPNGSDIPVSPKPLLLLVLGPLMGIMFPMVLIYVRNLVNDKINSVEDLEAWIEAPVLGDIPNSKLKNKIVVTNNTMTNIAEAFRILRAKIIFSLKERNNGKIVFVTSTLAEEGKTFVTANLASAFGLLEKKVLIIEADIRNPKLKTYFNMDEKKGLTDYLLNPTLTIQDLIQSLEGKNVDIIPSGGQVNNPSELLSNESFNEIIAYGRSNYDYVFVDTAPFGILADTLYLKDYADLLLYVIEANNISKNKFQKIKKLYNKNELSNLSFLLNKSDSKRSNYGYKYGY